MEYTVLLFLFLCVASYHGTNCERFYIITSPESRCPGEYTGEPCFTLQQYVATPSQSPNVTLILESGNHELNSDLIVENAEYFSIDSVNAIIVCGGINKQKLSFISVQILELIGVNFTRCGDLKFNQLSNVNIVNTSFFGCGYSRVNSLGTMQLTNVVIRGSKMFLLESVDQLFFQNCTIREFLRLTHGGSLNISQSRIFNIRAGTLRISDVTHVVVIESTFVNMGANSDGAIFSEGASSMTVLNSNFSHNHAYGEGGAIYISGGSLTITNSTFDSNSADGGRGGAIFSSSKGSVMIIQCTFINNSAQIDGGAIFISDGGFLTVKNSTFISNKALGIGGGISAVSKFIATSQSVFKNNTAEKGGAVFFNGIFSSFASYFYHNTATLQGGAVYTNSSHISVQLNESSFVGNTAINTSGGAIYVGGKHTNVLLFESTFNNNSAGYCGVMDVDKIYHNVDIIGSTFGGNTATGQAIGGGVACIRNASVTISNCTFRRNSAIEMDGGCLHVEESTMTVNSSSFISNMAKGNGGVMLTIAYPTSYIISHSVFSDNQAENGGVIYINRKGSNVRVLNETVLNYNRASNKGGAISITGSMLEIGDTSIDSNTATLGGIISACNSDVRLQASDQVKISKDPNISVCSYYDEVSKLTSLGDHDTKAATQNQTTTIVLHVTTTDRPPVSSQTESSISQPTDTQSQDTDLHDVVLTSNNYGKPDDSAHTTEATQPQHRASNDIVIQTSTSDGSTTHPEYTQENVPAKSQGSIVASAGYQSTALPVTSEMLTDITITSTYSPLRIVYTLILLFIVSVIVLVSLIIAAVMYWKHKRTNGKFVKYRYPLTGLYQGYQYRPVPNENIIEFEPNSGHLQSAQDCRVNSQSESDEEL